MKESIDSEKWRKNVYHYKELRSADAMYFVGTIIDMHYA